MPCPLFPVFALPPLQQIPGIGLLSECVRTETLGEMAGALPVEILQAGIVAPVCVQESFFVRPGRVGRSPPAEKVEDSPFGISPEHHDGLYRAFVPGIIPDGNLAGIRVHLDRYGKRLLHACLIGYSTVPLEGILIVSVPSRPGASICPLSVISRGAYSMMPTSGCLLLSRRVRIPVGLPLVGPERSDSMPFRHVLAGILVMTTCLMASPAAPAPLHLAAMAGNRGLVEELLAEGEDVNGTDHLQRTPLHWASEAGNESIAELLIDKGADVDARDMYADTPLHRAVVMNRGRVVALLVLRGADVNAKDRFGQTPMLYAAYKGNQAVVSLLIESGAGVNARDQGRNTPLHNAIYMDHEAIATLLVIRGADVNAANNYRITPLHLASLKGYDDLVRLCLARGADVNARDIFGATPMQNADHRGFENILRLLEENGGHR